MSVVISSYHSGRPSKVDVATVIEYLPMFQTGSLPRCDDRGVPSDSGVGRFNSDGRCEPQPYVLLPDAECSTQRDQLADVIGRVIGDEQNRAHVRLVALAGRDLRGQVFDVAGQRLHLVARLRE